MPSFDTLQVARKLEQAGFPRNQAEELTVALARIVGGAPTATRVSSSTPGAWQIPTQAAASLPDFGVMLPGLQRELAGVTAKLRKELLEQQLAQRSWFNGAMTVWTLVNVFTIAAAAVVVYMALGRP